MSWLKKQHVGKVVKTKKFNNALTNDVFLIRNSENIAFIFKRLNQQARSENDRQAEFLVQQLAYQHGLTPQVLAHNKHYKLQQFIAGDLINEQDVTLFQHLVNQLIRIHKLPVLHAPKQRLGFELLRLKQQVTEKIDESVFQKRLHLATQLDQECPNDTLCHGDLSVNNVLVGTDKHLYILDWEYAVIACAAYDLAFCCCINQFSAKDSRQLIELYYGQYSQPLAQSLDSLQKQCDLYFQVFTYINELWSLCFLEKDN
tara:strand:- start:83 stop:856 length:774 start_codon:yes stop_codon:yes gene_type:complete